MSKLFFHKNNNKNNIHKKKLESILKNKSKEELNEIGLKLKNSSPADALIFIGSLMKEGE